MAKVAFITGANGITGSAILEYLVQHTTASEWSQIILTSRSPLKMIVTDPRVQFIALDFSKTSEKLVEAMRETCAPVTHAYFSSYVHMDDFAELNIANKALFENFLTALLEVAPNLQNCTLQTGGKHYNLHLHPVPSPAREEEPRRGDPNDNFYFPQEDFLMEKQRGASWTWNVIMPEAIIGWTPKPNGMNQALTIALYFLICKELGTEAKMPTNELYWKGTDDCSDSRLIADLTVFVSTNPKCANQAFNLVNGDFYTWRYMWPRLAEWFGASASSDQTFDRRDLTEGERHLDLSLAEWAQDKRPVWDRLCEKAGVPQAKATFAFGTWAFQDWVFQRTWSATLSINKARKYGWTGHIDSFESFTDAFRKFRELEQIP
jgi:nucleoside-diphosphate-sugar epimerase